MKKLILVVLVFLVGCALPTPTPKATVQDRQVVLSSVGEQGIARVHFFIGEWEHGKIKDICTFYVNGTKVGSGNSDFFSAVDLVPGKYSFSWQLQAGSTYFDPVPIELTLRPDDRVYLIGTIVNKSDRAAGLLFGPIGALAGMKYYYIFNQDPTNGPVLLRQKELVELNTSLKDALR